MEPTPGLPIPPTRVSLGALPSIACACVILSSVVFAVTTVRQARVAGPLRLDYAANTTVDAASLTFTNSSDASGYACAKGIVTRKNGGQKAESFEVCTGEMKPHSTVSLNAPYYAVDLREMCAGDPDRFGTVHLDWSKCSFRVEVTSPLPQSLAAFIAFISKRYSGACKSHVVRQC